MGEIATRRVLVRGLEPNGPIVINAEDFDAAQHVDYEGSPQEAVASGVGSAPSTLDYKAAAKREAAERKQRSKAEESGESEA